MLTWDERVRIKGKIHGKENKNQIRGITLKAEQSKMQKL